MDYVDYACKLFTGKLVRVRVKIECVRYFISKYLPLNQCLFLLVYMVLYVSVPCKNIKIYMYNNSRDQSAGHLDRKWNFFATYCSIYFYLFSLLD